MAGTTADRSRMRVVGAEIRALRTAAGLGVRELAKVAGITSHARVSLAENGKQLLSEADAVKLLNALQVDTELRTRILVLIREAGGPGRILSGLPGIGPVMSELIGYERDAVRITDFSLGLIPGLLQTSEYARAIMGDQPGADTRVALRVGRRDVLTRSSSPAELVALIDSEVLVRAIAGPDVMLDQLRFLLTMSERPNVTIRLVSSTVGCWHPGLAGPFELIAFAKASPVVLLEHHRSSLFLLEPDDVAEFVDAAEQIMAVAMTPEESSEVIAFLIKGRESQERQ